MKLRIALSTATAIGLFMGAAVAGDNNETYSVQDGDFNTLSVLQNGNNNDAGRRTTFNEYLKQDGDNNLMTVNQTGNSNVVAGNGPSNSGAFQTGDRNKLTVDQTSFGYNQHGNGHRINHIRQNSSDTATSDTNTAEITQRGTTDLIVGQGPSAGHFIGVVTQTHTTGAANTLDIEQAGAFSAWYSGGQHNRIATVTQNGSGNEAELSQDGTGPVLTPSGQQQRGPSNVINTVQQTGDGNDATVTQNGFQNYVESVTQGGVGGNKATVILNGNFNGATASAGHSGHPTLGLFTPGRGAEAAGASASTVSQTGEDNSVQYTVVSGDSNQFGFYQNGEDNKANAIFISGNNNELGVHQTGTNNSLTLAAINDDDNVFGLKQNGVNNTASIASSGGKNGGYSNFTGGSPAELLASGQGLTAGLLEQKGTFNQVSLTVSGGSNNVFASLQNNDDFGATSTWNKITATQTGSDNQAAVVQLGDMNTTTITQTGGNNNASIKQ